MESRKQTPKTQKKTALNKNINTNNITIHQNNPHMGCMEMLQYKENELSKAEAEIGFLYTHIEELNKQLELANTQLAELRKYNHQLLTRKKTK